MTRWQRWSPRGLLLWQVLSTIGAWGLVVVLHLENDGLWYHGDAARHAANGVFWLDFLRHFPAPPVDFAFSYYARYPVINPTAYPPLFYLLEAGAYQVFGVSPFVGKGLVLAAVLVGALYAIAWLRRWVSEDAGWAGGLFVTQPSMIVWGNAVMLNVPSMVLGVSALYHWRRWLERPDSRQVYPAAVFAMLAVLTYLPTAIVLVVMLVWALWSAGPRVFEQRRVWGLAGGTAIPIGAWVFMTIWWAPSHWEVGFSGAGFPFWTLAAWMYFPRHLPTLIRVAVLVLAAVGAGLGLLVRPWRREVGFLLLWAGLGWVWVSVLPKDARYAVLVVPPLVLLGAVGVVAGLWLFERGRLKTAGWWVAPVWIALLALHLGLATMTEVPRVSGFREVVQFVREVAPSERVFYDGVYNGVFSFYMRAADTAFRRQVVLGSKLLYATRIEPALGVIEVASSPAAVAQSLRVRCGCRILVVERQIAPLLAGITAPVSLREVAAREARLLRSFRVETDSVRDVDVYEFRDVEANPTTVELPFPALGEGVWRRVAPIER